MPMGAVIGRRLNSPNRPVFAPTPKALGETLRSPVATGDADARTALSQTSGY